VRHCRPAQACPITHYIRTSVLNASIPSRRQPTNAPGSRRMSRQMQGRRLHGIALERRQRPRQQCCGGWRHPAGNRCRTGLTRNRRMRLRIAAAMGAGLVGALGQESRHLILRRRNGGNDRVTGRFLDVAIDLVLSGSTDQFGACRKRHGRQHRQQEFRHPAGTAVIGFVELARLGKGQGVRPARGIRIADGTGRLCIRTHAGCLRRMMKIHCRYFQSNRRRMEFISPHPPP
jgi:hypothetical protein